MSRFREHRAVQQLLWKKSWTWEPAFLTGWICGCASTREAANLLFLDRPPGVILGVRRVRFAACTAPGIPQSDQRPEGSPWLEAEGIGRRQITLTDRSLSSAHFPQPPVVPVPIIAVLQGDRMGWFLEQGSDMWSVKMMRENGSGCPISPLYNKSL